MRYSFKFASTTLKSSSMCSEQLASPTRPDCNWWTFTSIDLVPGSQVRRADIRFWLQLFANRTNANATPFWMQLMRARDAYVVYIKYIYQGSNGLGCIGDRDVNQYHGAQEASADAIDGILACVHDHPFWQLRAYCMCLCALVPLPLGHDAAQHERRHRGIAFDRLLMINYNQSKMTQSERLDLGAFFDAVEFIWQRQSGEIRMSRACWAGTHVQQTAHLRTADQSFRPIQAGTAAECNSVPLLHCMLCAARTGLSKNRQQWMGEQREQHKLAKQIDKDLWRNSIGFGWGCKSYNWCTTGHYGGRRKESDAHCTCAG